MGDRTLTNEDLQNSVLCFELLESGEARDLRKRFNLTLDDIAGKLETTATTVARWEGRRRRPRRDIAARYGALLRQLQESAVVNGAEDLEKEESRGLVGRFFHGDVHRQWQGCVIVEPSPGVYLVELFSWSTGDPTSQRLVRLAEMGDWHFYDTADWMRNRAKVVTKRWKAQERDGQLQVFEEARRLGIDLWDSDEEPS